MSEFTRLTVFFRCLLILFTLQFAMAQPDSSEAQLALKEFGQVCAKEGAALWGVSLCGRLMLVEPKTRLAVATARIRTISFKRKAGCSLESCPPNSCWRIHLCNGDRTSGPWLSCDCRMTH